MKLQLTSKGRHCSSISVRELSMKRMYHALEVAELDNIGVGV